MSAPQPGRHDSIARRWLALVERRQQHFVELSETGRWRHYYTQTEFLDEMRKVVRLRDQWAAIAGAPLTGEVGAPSGQVVLLDKERLARRPRAALAHQADGATTASSPD
ncbi:MAG TPA: TIGR03809 family protein [Xanthobacteraceae bacterium]|nr:TIGR03809 family protein [Xanthobacteraceae bacterium]